MMAAGHKVSTGHAQMIVNALAQRQMVMAASQSKPRAVDVQPKKEMGAAVLWLGILACASVGMTIGNKAIMLHYPFPNSLASMQNGITALFLYVGFLGNVVAINKMTTAQWQTFGVTAFLLAFQIMSSLKSLPLVAIATVSTISTCVLVLCVFSHTLYRTDGCV